MNCQNSCINEGSVGFGILGPSLALFYAAHRRLFLPEDDYYDFDNKGLRLVARSEWKLVYGQLVSAE
jgi:hypothetical protein